jgi:hypothetical protein
MPSATNLRVIERIFNILRALSARYAVEYAAPTQVVANVIQYKTDEAVNISVENVNSYTVTTKPRLLDRWLDKAVKFSRLEFMFFSIMIALLA